MPAVAKADIKARAARLRAAGELALARHLERQVGQTVTGLVERGGVARGEDFTEIAFEGPGEVGQIIELKITRLFGVSRPGGFCLILFDFAPTGIAEGPIRTRPPALMPKPTRKPAAPGHHPGRPAHCKATKVAAPSPAHVT